MKVSVNIKLIKEVINPFRIIAKTKLNDAKFEYEDNLFIKKIRETSK